MTFKLKKKFEEYKEKEGTTHLEESMTDQSQAEDTDIYQCLKKYGITTLVNQTMAKEFLYLDNTNRNMTLDEAVRQRNELDEYFGQLPARVRKKFGDSTEVFAQKFKAGEFNTMIETGILNQELAEAYMPIKEETEGEIKNEQMEKDIINNESVLTDINQGNN